MTLSAALDAGAPAIDRLVAQSMVSEVTDELRSYAERGVFRKFSILPANRGLAKARYQTCYKFNWLSETPINLVLNPKKSSLNIVDVLPGIAYRSNMDKEFRSFLRDRTAAEVPEHRKLDDQRFKISCTNRHQCLSVSIGFENKDGRAAVKQVINLIHEIFNNFLHEGYYQNYVVEHFNEPEE